MSNPVGSQIVNSKEDLAAGPRYANVSDIRFSNESDLARLQFQSFDITR